VGWAEVLDSFNSDERTGFKGDLLRPSNISPSASTKQEMPFQRP
jgi:hypothetical protein